MSGMWDVRDAGCWGCGMLGMWDVRDVGCSECGMFAGIWDVDLQNALKSNTFIPVVIDLEAATQYIREIIRCLCKTDCSSGRYERRKKLLWTYACSSRREIT